jgi:hypothetical protein
MLGLGFKLDYRPDEEAVKRCKYWTGWRVRDL